MVVATTDYGTFKTHVGTVAEVAGAMKGVPATHIMAVYYDSGSSKTTAWVKSSV